MNTIAKITLYQFRNYSSASFQFDAPVTCISGVNGSGKTNLLDAVYYLCYTKSYFTSYQQNCVQQGKDGFRLEGAFYQGGKNETISCKWRAGKKEIFANGVEYEKPNDHIGKYSSVIIAPDDMELINDGSELRRKWVDSILGQTDRQYLEQLLHYQRVLLQRNAWLKAQAINQAADYTQLDYYNAELTRDANYIYARRVQFIAEFLPLLERFYRELSGGRETIRVRYESDLATKGMAEWLESGLQHDLRFQRTLRGIHKDDWAYGLGELSLKQFGSQGQKKSFLFALKLAQYAYISQQLHHLPILLLDDIFEKLDQHRMEALLRIIRDQEFGQVILTDTHPQRIQDAFGAGADLAFIHL